MMYNFPTQPPVFITNCLVAASGAWHKQLVQWAQQYAARGELLDKTEFGIDTLSTTTDLTRKN